MISSRHLIMKTVLCVLAWLLLAVTSICADDYRVAYLEFKQTSPDTFEMLWKAPMGSQGQGFSLDVKLPSDVKVIEVQRPLLADAAIISRSIISRAGGLTGAAVAVDGLERVSTDVLVRIQRLNDSIEVFRLTAAKPAFVITSAATNMDVAKTYVVFGVEHILQGVDHLLFVACLVFIAGSWGRILATITGFTLAHSITLTLATLNLVQLPIAPVEVAISLSIVFLAREIFHRRRDTLTWRFPIAISMIFGLLHGFGFASALSDIGLPQTDIAAALLAFNVGVEIGQVGFVAALLGVFYLAKICVALFQELEERSARRPVHTNALRWLERPVAAGVGGVAMFWMIERLVLSLS